jgi:hypothetical protein
MLRGRPYPHSFEGFPQRPHYPYGPHFGYVQAGLEERGEQFQVGDLSDITLPGIVLPPLGVMQALSSHDTSKKSDRPSSKWPLAAILGVLGLGGFAVYAIYKLSSSVEPVTRKAGELTARVLKARYAPTLTRGIGSSRARHTLLPSAPRALAASRSQKPYTLRALPEYEAYR